MSDPISPLGSPGQVPQAANLLPNAAPSAGVEEAFAPVQALAPAAAKAAKATAATLPAASKLELSPQATSATVAEAPKVMDMADAAKAFQDYLTNLPSDLQFIPDASSGIVVFKVINPITLKVLRQYPP